MNLFRRTPASDIDEFDVAIGRPTDDPVAVARALESAGIDAHVVVPEDGGRAVVKIRHDDVPAIQEALERHLR